MGPRRLLREGSQPLGVERVQCVEHGLVVAAHLLGDAGRSFAPRTGEQDLAAAQHKAVLGTQAVLQGLAFRVRERTHKDGSSHSSQRTTFSFTYSEAALGNARSADCQSAAR